MSYPSDNFPTPYDLYDGAESGTQADICEGCGQPIYVGEDYYDINGEPYCEDCVHDMRKVAERD